MRKNSCFFSNYDAQSIEDELIKALQESELVVQESIKINETMWKINVDIMQTKEQRSEKAKEALADEEDEEEEEPEKDEEEDDDDAILLDEPEEITAKMQIQLLKLPGEKPGEHKFCVDFVHKGGVKELFYDLYVSMQPFLADVNDAQL